MGAAIQIISIKKCLSKEGKKPMKKWNQVLAISQKLKVLHR